MAQERPATPEKQLLKLIEDPKIQSSKTFEPQAVKRKGLSLLSLGAWIGRISFFRTSFKGWAGEEKPQLFDIRTINKVLGFLVIVVISYSAQDITSSAINLRKMPKLQFKIQEEAEGTSYFETLAVKKAASYYLEKVKKRNIFKMGVKEVIADAGSEDIPSSSEKESKFAHLRLVGISWSKDPDAMLEDTKALRTFFVKRGDMIQDIKVEAIFKDKVILNYDGHEIELR